MNACPATWHEDRTTYKERDATKRATGFSFPKRQPVPTSSRLYWTGAVTSMGLSGVGPSHLKETEPRDSHSVAQQFYPAASLATIVNMPLTLVSMASMVC